MSLFYQPKAIVVILLLASICSWSYAHNGAIAHAYPMESITVDADLSDWPDHFQKYPISYYQYGFKPESADDIRGYFIIGYNHELQEVYIGVEMIDDSYIIFTNSDSGDSLADDLPQILIEGRPVGNKETTGGNE